MRALKRKIEKRAGTVKLGPRAWACLLLGLAATAGVGQPPPQQSRPEERHQVGQVSGTVSGMAGVMAQAEAISRVGAAGDMIGFSHSDASGTQTITLVHTGKSWMAVYHIDRSGKIRLVSSRPIDSDFSLQLNATSPLPEDIRQLGRR